MIDSTYISLPEIMKTINAMGMVGMTDEMIGAGMRYQRVKHKVEDGVLKFDRAQALQSLLLLADCWEKSRKMLEGKTDEEAQMICRLNAMEAKLHILGDVVQQLYAKLGEKQ